MLNEKYKERNAEFIFSLLVNGGSSGLVSKKTYESIHDEILEDPRNAGKLDGILLKMHGAIHAEGY